MSRINFRLSLVEHEKSFITSGPGPPLSKFREKTGRASDYGSRVEVRALILSFCVLEQGF